MKQCKRRPDPGCKRCGGRLDRRRRAGRTPTGVCRVCHDSLDLLSREELRRHGTCGLAPDKRLALRERSAQALAAGKQRVTVAIAELDALLNATTAKP